MTESKKIKLMFSALRKVETREVPDKLIEDVTEIRPDVPCRDEEYDRLKDEGYWD